MGDEKADVSKKSQPYPIDTLRHKTCAKMLGNVLN